MMLRPSAGANKLVPGLTTSAVESCRWLQVPCPLCGCEQGKIVAESLGTSPTESGQKFVFAAMQCLRCQLIFTNPRPDPESQHYTHTRTTRREVQQSWFSRLMQLVRPTSTEDEFVADWCEPGTLLDCAAEHVPSLTIDDAYDCDVLRFTPEHDVWIEHQSSLRHRDNIVLRQTLETQQDPRAFLEEVFHLLVPEGRLITFVPHWERNRKQLDLPHQLTHFIPETLKMLLTTVGFKVIYCEAPPRGRYIRCVALRCY